MNLAETQHTSESKWGYLSLFLGSPEVVCPLKDIRASDGSTCCFECVVLASPAPIITWHQNNDQLEMLDSIMTSYDETSGKALLELSDITPESAGKYRCVFKNVHGEAESAATLQVDSKLKSVLYSVENYYLIYLSRLQDYLYELSYLIRLNCDRKTFS